jgi:DNA-binding NarL/FixJ family response regulator
MKMIKVNPVKDRDFLLENVGKLLGRSEEIEVVGMSGTLKECWMRLEKSHSNVLLLNIKTKEEDVWAIDFFDFFREVSENHPDVKMLMFTAHNAPVIEDQEPKREQNRYGLSEIEYGVLELLVDGCTTKDMAAKLFLGINGIKKVRKRLFDKLEVDKATMAVRKAIEEGLLTCRTGGPDEKSGKGIPAGCGSIG